MLFNSYIFVLLFLPLCVIGYFALNRIKTGAANLFLLGMSLWFYGYLNPRYLTIICSSILLNYCLSFLIRRSLERRLKKVLLILGIVTNLGILGYFKYMDFFISNFNGLFQTDFGLLHIALPLGISFFTFQQLSFIVDTYWGKVNETDFVTYACYVSFFPQLVAGPIVTHDEFLPQFLNQKNRSVNWENLARGIYTFVLGLSKKVIIADSFGLVVSAGYIVIPDLNSPSAIFFILSYTLQIYFDFSGYCDMAIGIGRMFNIELPGNFNSPYKAVSITDFWDRWHMTLTRFFTKYVYIPLGGNRKGTVRTCVNVMIVFLLSGLWHGASWNFVFWGGCHGLLMVIERLLKNKLERIPKIIRGCFTFLFVNVMWVFFRAANFGQAFEILGKVFTGGKGGLPFYFTACFQPNGLDFIVQHLPMSEYLPTVMTLMFTAVTCCMTFFARNVSERMKRNKLTAGRAILTAALLVWCILSFENVSAFLYFNF
ncbi:MAG: MBOAT family protein [Acetatifactor sp.]|nr:MBOAT family protein [Acetatifactor sp.]